MCLDKDIMTECFSLGTDIGFIVKHTKEIQFVESTRENQFLTLRPHLYTSRIRKVEVVEHW